jgi:hypothetical protein
VKGELNSYLDTGNSVNLGKWMANLEIPNRLYVNR